jgi:membrane protein implicated in regulation of membrane protease activity
MLQGIYIGCTVFSVGITTLDFLGILGRHDDSDTGDTDAGGDLDATYTDAHGDFDAGDIDASGDFDAGDVDASGDLDAGDMDIDGDSDAGHIDHADDADDGESGHVNDVDSADTPHHGAVAVLSVLSYLRSLVYFCLGFGPTGWFALTAGNDPTRSLMWALPAGAIAFVVARAFFRFQRSDTDSTLRSEELMFQRATVIVPLSHRTMGKIRVQVGMNVTEQYALAAEPNTQFEKGELVWVTNVTDECVYVEDELGRK